MKNILNDINDNVKILIQQEKKRVENSFIQSGEKSMQIQTQNNFGSYNILKPLLLNNNQKKFIIYRNIVNKKNIIYSSVSLFIVGLLPTLYFKYYIGLDVSVEIIFTYIIINILYLFFIRFIGKKNYFTLENNRILLTFKEDIELKYSEIRSYLTMKDLHGYSMYIYKIDEVYPIIEFNIESIHSVNAIEEFLMHQIQNKD